MPHCGNAMTTSQHILLIRANAGNTCETCPICNRAPHDPFRRYDKLGKVIMGCVDACHTDKVTGTDESKAWHMLGARLRRLTLEHLKSL